MPFAATWLDLEITIPSKEVRKRKTDTIQSDVESKIWHKWICLQISNRLTDLENKRVVLKGKGEGGINQEFAICGYTLLCIKQMTNEDLLYRGLYRISCNNL